MSHQQSLNPFMQIYERYVDEASFLWILRGVALDQPHYTPDDIKALEMRIDRHLEGLMTSPIEAWPACNMALNLQEPGEVFASSVIAFRCADPIKIQQVVETAELNEALLWALASSFDWLSGQLCHDWIIKFFTSKNFMHKRLALDTCSLRAENPGNYLRLILEREDCRKDFLLYARALRSIGEFKRHDLISFIEPALISEDESVRFWALYAGLLLGNREYVDELKPYVLAAGQFRDDAIQLAFRILPVATSRDWIGELAKQDDSARVVIKATTVLGDPQAVNWLLSQMHISSLACLAAESFSTITGISLIDHDLDIDSPEKGENTNDPSDKLIELDEDENLPFPDVAKVIATWQQYASGFVFGQRYFMGKAIVLSELERQLNFGLQRHRHAAALELALMQPELPLVNTYARFKLVGSR